MTVPEFANMVCRDLPEGWNLALEMEHHGGGFELYDPNGDRVDPEDYTSVDEEFLQQGLDALAYAIEREECLKVN